MVELFALGGLDLRRGGERLERVVSQPKRTALLVYLAVATPRGFHARDTLLALLWPESDRRRARSSLRKALHFLRRHLGKDAIGSSGDALGLSADVWCDVVAFDRALEEERLEDAVELYGGDLLSGFHVSGAPEFERWLDGERRRLRRSAVRAAWELSDAAEAAGRPIEAARLGRRALAIEPLDEPNTRRLMSLLHRLGDRAGALRVYEQAAERLRSELELEPTAETRELRDRLLADTPAAGPSAGEAAPAPAEDVDAPRAAGTEDPDPRMDEAPAREDEGGVGAPDTSPVAVGAAAPRRPSRTRSAVLGVAALAILLVGGLFVNRLASGEDAAVDGETASTVAVLPFGIGGDEEGLWREGMATLLAAGFHGVAGLTAREPEFVLKLWQSEFGDAAPTAEAARNVGRTLGAGWVVTGRLVGYGREIRLSGEAVRTADGERAGPVVVDGHRDSLFTVVDRFTVELLRAGMVPADHEALPVDLSRVTTSSREALEAYLEGEQRWRSAELEEAGDAFSRAIRHDSTFALAHYRLAMLYRWLGPPTAVLPRLRSAARHVHRLHDREASLVRGTLALEEGRLAEGIDTLRAVVTREPSYAEGWVRYGDAIQRYGQRLLVPLADFRRALLRATEVNPLASEPYWSLIEDAFFREDSVGAGRLVEEYRRVDPYSPACIGYETAFMLSWGNEVARSFAESRLDTLGGGRREPLTCALVALALAPRHRPALEIVAAELESADRPASERRRPLAFRNRSDVRGGRIAEARATLREAYREASREVAARRVLLLDMVTYPDPDAAGAAARVLREAETPQAWFWLGAWHLHHGRVGAARALTSELRAADEAEAADLARALELLASSDLPVPVRARRLTEVQERISSDFLIPQWLRLRIGELLLESGQPVLALRYLESLTMDSYPLSAPAFFLQGAAHEALGHTEAAREAYRRFLRWWADADPELEPWKERAREALLRLGARTG